MVQQGSDLPIADKAMNEASRPRQEGSENQPDIDTKEHCSCLKYMRVFMMDRDIGSACWQEQKSRRRVTTKTDKAEYVQQCSLPFGPHQSVWHWQIPSNFRIPQDKARAVPQQPYRP